MIHELVLRDALQEISLRPCGDGWVNLCSLIAQRTTGVQPRPPPDSNQPDSVRLLEPDIIHTHTPQYNLLNRT